MHEEAWPGEEMTMRINARQLTLAILVAVALVSGATAAHAGYYYEAVTTTVSEDAGMNGATTVSVWVDGDSTKIQFASGQQVGVFGPGTYLVTRDAGENLYLVNPEEKTYSNFNLGQMLGTVSQVMEGMGNLLKVEFADVHSKKVSEGPGGTILGYGTTHVTFQSGYTMRMAVMGMKQENTVEMDQEVWVTDAFDPRAFTVWLRPDKRMSGMFEGLDEMMEAEFSKIDGVPLKGVVKTTTTDKKGRVTTSTSTTEVIALREDSVPASTFEIPAGYTETQVMPDMSQIEQEADEADDEQDEGRRPKLRDLLKRRKNG
jgi:hypothetical protein